jgi:hypothetical protein
LVLLAVQLQIEEDQ